MSLRMEQSSLDDKSRLTTATTRRSFQRIRHGHDERSRIQGGACALLNRRLHVIVVHLILSCFFFTSISAWVIPTKTAAANPVSIFARSLHNRHSTISTIHSPSAIRTNCHNAPSDTAKLSLRLLVIDHYDSFTYNLVDMLGRICEETPIVIAAPTHDITWEDFCLEHGLSGTDWDGIILSPGPGHPRDCHLATQAVIENPAVPILGVCLGHQVLGIAYGANCVSAPIPIHGQVEPIHLTACDDVRQFTMPAEEDEGSSDMVNGKPPSLLLSSLNVTRYHSLQVQLPQTDQNQEQLPIMPTAISDDGQVIMGLQHIHNPHYGVQFHPESIGSQPGGFELLQRFCSICQEYSSQRVARTGESDSRSKERRKASNRKHALQNRAQNKSQYTVYIHRVPELQTVFTPQDAMLLFYNKNSTSHFSHRFWLDEATGRGEASVSLLGASPKRVEYWGPEKEKRLQGLHLFNKEDSGSYEFRPNVDIIEYLQEQHTQAAEHVNMVSFMDNNGQDHIKIETQHESEVDLPFAFRGGHVGYLGYEVRHVTEAFWTQQEEGTHDPPRILKDSKPSSIPTSAFVFSTQSMVFHHPTKTWYLVGVSNSKDVDDKTNMLKWMQQSSREIVQGSVIDNAVRSTDPKTTVNAFVSSDEKVSFIPNRSRETYGRNFESCLQHIRDGDSYELCLTNQLEATVQAPGSSPLELYLTLREKNPAPFSAFFDWNSAQTHNGETGSSLAVCCSSPERFISVAPILSKEKADAGRFLVEAKPIKGTCARILPESNPDMVSQGVNIEALDKAVADELQSSVKNRAENLMIVDLLRNDLSRVCRVGSVHVSKLMEIESYATVHQMVSTIRGVLDTNIEETGSPTSTVDVLMSCFPGGSMTGAPKMRTMELLDVIEEGVPRGPYSGSLGYVSLNGAIDMNKVIRTAILTPSENEEEWHVSIGAGGAVTALSENDDEYEEMILKASAVVQAVQTWSLSSKAASLENANGEGTKDDQFKCIPEQ